MRYRFPRTAAHRFAERFNCEMNIPDGLCVRQPVEVKVPPRYRGQVECPSKLIRGFNKQFAALCPVVAVIVAEVPLNRGRDASINYAGALPGCHVGGVHGVEVQTYLRHALQQGGGANKCPFCNQSCHVLQPIGVADAVVGVDTEPDAEDNSRRHAHPGGLRRGLPYPQMACRDLLHHPEAGCLYPAINEHDRVKGERLHKVRIALSNGSNAQLFEGINPDILASLRRY